MKEKSKPIERLIAEAKENGLIDAIGDAISIQDTDFKILYQNQAQKELNGEHVGESCYKAYARKDGICEECALAECFKDGKIHETVQRAYIDGREFFVEITASPIKDSEGNIVAGIEVVRDVTERKMIERALVKEKDRAQTYLDIAGTIIVAIDSEQNVSLINRKGCDILACMEEDVIGRNWFDNFLPERIRDEVKEAFNELMAGNIEAVEYYENPVLTKKGEERLIAWHNTVLKDEEGNIAGTLSSGEDITERKKSEAELTRTLSESEKRKSEISALLEGSRAVLEYSRFQDAARSIFNSCRDIIGATAGYVALLSPNGTENEVLFLDSGGLSCSVDPSLPMPIRGLRETAYRSGMTVYDNGFTESEWMKFIPEGHVRLDNVLFAPLMIDGKVNGIMGLANKPGGFNDHDSRLASGFGELSAIALKNSTMFDELADSEEKFRTLVETAHDAVISIDSSGDIALCNRAACDMFGYSEGEIFGMPLTSLMPEKFREAHTAGFERISSTGKLSNHGKTLQLSGLRKDGSEFPLELTVSAWRSKDGTFFTGILRDITERKTMEDELQKSRDELEVKVRERTEELMSVVELLHEGITDRKRIAEEFRESENKYRALFDHAPDSLLLIDAETGAIAMFNNTACESLGYTRDEFEKLKLHDFEVVESEEEVKMHVRKIIEVGHDLFETKHRRKDGQIRDVLVSCEAVSFEGRYFSQSIITDITDQKRAEEQIRAYQGKLRELMSRLSIMEDKERKLIAEELHDNITQNLAISVIRLEALQQDPACKEKDIQGIRDMISQTIEFTRSLTFELSSPVLHELGFRAAVEWLTEEFQKKHGIGIKFISSGRFRDMTEELGALLFKAIRELLFNIVKHANASNVIVAIKNSGDCITVNVDDDGTGFDSEGLQTSPGKTGGFGLFNIRERITYAGGSIEISSGHGKGTAVTIVVPLTQLPDKGTI